MQDSDFADALRIMTAEQKELMARTGAGVPGPVGVETKREQREVFVRHGDRLRELLTTGGWPSADRVGPNAARKTWLIAQHADTQLDVQRLALRLLRGAVAEGLAGERELAFLEDRVAMNEGRRQIYGTRSPTSWTAGPSRGPASTPPTWTSAAPVSVSNRSRRTPPVGPDCRRPGQRDMCRQSCRFVSIH